MFGRLGARLHRRAPVVVALVSIIVLAAILRFATLGLQSVWYDEAQTARLVSLPLDSMLHAVAGEESTPPLFYLLERATTRLLGDGEVGLRALSALAGLLTVLVAMAIAKEVAGRRAAAATGVVAALSPLLVWYAQEARSYSLYALLVSAALWGFVRALLRPAARRSTLVFAASGSAAVLTHWFAIAPIGACATYLVYREVVARRQARRFQLARPTVAGQAGPLAALPLFTAVLATPLLLAQRSADHTSFIASEPLARRLAQLPKQLLVGYDALFEPWSALAGAIGAALLLALAVQRALGNSGGVRRIASPTAHRALAGAAASRPLEPPQTVLLLLFVAALAGVGAPLVAALLGEDFVLTRNVLWLACPLAVLVGVGFARAPRSVAWPALVLVVSAAAAGTAAPLVDALARKPDWRGIARLAAHTVGPVGTVVVAPDGVLPVRYYEPRLSVVTVPPNDPSKRFLCASPARKSGSSPRAPTFSDLPCPVQVSTGAVGDASRSPDRAPLRIRPFKRRTLLAVLVEPVRAPRPRPAEPALQSAR